MVGGQSVIHLIWSHSVLDLKMLRNDPEPIRQALLKRMDNVDFGPVFELDKQRRDLISQVDANRSQRKAHAKQIGRLRATGGDWEALEKEATALKDQLAGLESALSEVDEALQRTLNEFPNYPDERIPAGGKENNQVVRTWGDKPELTESALDHVELSKRLGLIDYERGTKLGGNGSGCTPVTGPPSSGPYSISFAENTGPMGTSFACRRIYSSMNVATLLANFRSLETMSSTFEQMRVSESVFCCPQLKQQS